MIALLLLASLLVEQSASPTPTPSLPPEIIHTVTSERCTTLQKLMLPVGFDSKNNDQIFGQMAGQMQDYLKNVMVGDDPHIQRPNVNGGSTSGLGGASANNGTGSASTTGLSASQSDDPVAFNPKGTIDAAKIQRYAQQIYKTVDQERDLLKQSYAEYPEGHDAKLDQMRRQASDLMEVQSALAARYENFAETLLSNIDVAQMVNNTSGDLAAFKLNLRALVLGSTVNLDADPNKPGAASNFGFKSVKDLSKNANSAEVLGSMRYNEYGFASSLYDTYNQCRGTHYVMPPRPSGSHKR